MEEKCFEKCSFEEHLRCRRHLQNIVQFMMQRTTQTTTENQMEMHRILRCCMHMQTMLFPLRTKEREREK